jgi:hypothetical protein
MPQVSDHEWSDIAVIGVCGMQRTLAYCPISVEISSQVCREPFRVVWGSRGYKLALVSGRGFQTGACELLAIRCGDPELTEETVAEYFLDFWVLGDSQVFLYYAFLEWLGA